MPVETLIREELESPEMVEWQAPKPKSLVNLLPERLVLFLAKPYLAGTDPQLALVQAHQLFLQQNFCSTLDILGEDAQNDDDCEASVLAYKKLVDAIVANPLSVS